MGTQVLLHAAVGQATGDQACCSAGDPSSTLGSGRSPGGRHGNPHQCSCLENPRGQRSLAGYSPWGHKELRLTLSLSLLFILKKLTPFRNAFPSRAQTAMTGGTLNPRGEWAIPKDRRWQGGRPEAVSGLVPTCHGSPGTPPITRRLKFAQPWEGPGGGTCCQR